MAINRWLGQAVDVAQRDVFTIGGTWVTSDEITVTANGKTILITVGNDVSVDQVKTLIVQGIEGGSLSDASADVVPASGKQQFGELSEVTASVLSGFVLLTGNTLGKPHTVTITSPSALGTIIGPGASTVATGKNWFTDTANWSLGIVPATEGLDDIVFDHGDTDLLYGLVPSTPWYPLNLFIYASYTGRIGLHAENRDNPDPNKWYDEYRPRHLFFDTNVTPGTIAKTIIGEGVGVGSSRIFIDHKEHAVTELTVRQSAPRERSNEPCVQVKNSSGIITLADTVRGDVGYGVRVGDACHAPLIRTGWITSRGDDARVTVGPGFVTLADVILRSDGGTIFYDSDDETNLIDVEQSGGIVSIQRGKIQHTDVLGGTLIWNTPTAQEATGPPIGTNRLGGDGVLEFRQHGSAKALQLISKISAESVINDQNGVLTDPIIDLVGHDDASNIRLGPDRKHTVTDLP